MREKKDVEDPSSASFLQHVTLWWDQECKTGRWLREATQSWRDSSSENAGGRAHPTMTVPGARLWPRQHWHSWVLEKHVLLRTYIRIYISLWSISPHPSPSLLNLHYAANITNDSSHSCGGRSKAGSSSEGHTLSQVGRAAPNHGGTTGSV